VSLLLRSVQAESGYMHILGRLARCELCKDHFFLTNTVITLPELYIIMT
jgi:hypothetical protein